jgi:glucokinase-like ROK family protein
LGRRAYVKSNIAPNFDRFSAKVAGNGGGGLHLAAMADGDGVWDERLDALAQVLTEVRHGRASTRRELVNRTGLSRAVVAQRVRELLERGLLDESESAGSTGGRAARRLRLRPDTGQLLVADLGATSVDVAVTTLSAHIVARRSEPCDVAAGPEAVLGHIEELFADLLERSGADGPLRGVGLGVPGPVEFAAGVPVAPPIMPGWDRYPIRDRLVRAFGAPVWVDNDVNVMALGEARVGVAARHPNVVFIKVGTGIGAGLIMGGRLQRGEEGCAGDLGHIQVSDRVVCRCGNVGCLEALAGGAAIGRDGRLAASEGRSAALAEVLRERGAIEAADVAHAAMHGDPTSRELLTNAARLIGLAAAMVVNVVNPSMVVIGGGVAAAGDAFLAAIRQTVYGRSLPLATRRLLVERSSLGDSVGVIGCAHMVVDELLRPGRLSQWALT